MKRKSEKGSITIFVLVALLFYIGFLLLLYTSNINKIQTISEKLGSVKEIYEKNVDKVGEVYNKRIADDITLVYDEEELTTALASRTPLYIKLGDNITCTNFININNVSHQLDLNNFTISYTEQDDNFTFVTIGSGATLTILDSSNDKNGKLIGRISEDDTQNSGADRQNSIYTVNNQGTLIIQSGTVASDYLQDLDNVRDSIHVRGTATAIKNSGTVTVDGGAIVTTIETRGISYGATRNSEATGVGIENTGTVNLTSGNISITADAYMDRQGIIYGETKAYAYGVTNSGGTINREGTFPISVAATAHDRDKANTKKTTYKETQDQAEIKQN